MLQAQLQAPSQKQIAIIGSGPAGLMAADRAIRLGARVTVFEKRAGLGRKILIAGTSGLNITFATDEKSFLAHYRFGKSPGASGAEAGRARLRDALQKFSPAAWRDYVSALGEENFIGSSGRVLLREKKASRFLKRWIDALTKKGVLFVAGAECLEVRAPEPKKIQLRFSDGAEKFFRAVVFALGGGSWEDTLPAWPAMFSAHGIRVTPFLPRNVGYEIAGLEKF